MSDLDERQREADESIRRGGSSTLAQAALGHDNNLNLLRVLAAMLVLFSHSITVATGMANLEPGRSQFGLSLGDIAVDIFFVVSGFLVTGSLTRSNSLSRYAAARGLRILPGLWVALILTVTIVSVWFSALPPALSLTDPGSWRYLGRNAFVLAGADFSLPQAFANNPFPGSVNASLWTLPLEVWMYVFLAAEWWVSRRLTGRSATPLLPRLLFGSAVVLVVSALALALSGHPSNSLRHAAMFFSAAWMYEARARIVLTSLAAGAVAAAILIASMVSHGFFEVVYRFGLPYVVLYLAYVPAGLIRRYNRVGDFSYGIYIYAFPLQQVTAAIYPGIGTYRLFFISSAMTIVAAVLSWYLIESPSLKLRGKIERRT